MNTKKDWPFVMKDSQQFGRYLVSKKRISAGELILMEKPLLVYHTIEENNNLITCISCFSVFEKNQGVSCDKCRWQFCSRKCTKDEEHRKLECEALRRNGVLPSPAAEKFLYLLRVLLLKKRDRRKWDQIMDLTSTLGSNNPAYNKELHRQAIGAKYFLEVSFGIILSLDCIKKIANKFGINAFSAMPSNNSCCALFWTSSMFVHSCTPNAYFHFPGAEKKDLALWIYARKDIAAGEVVSLSYVEACIPKCTRERRDDLFQRFSFWCHCTRCEDPKELGTNYSSVKCSRCINGWLLPSKYDSPVRVYRYRCDTCRISLSSHKVEMIENVFQQKFNALKKRSEPYQRRMLDDMISKATLEYKLHPNHYMVIEAINYWLESPEVDLLLDSSAESKSLYQKISSRTEQALHIACSFGIFDRIVDLESVMASVMIRYHFKSQDYLSIGRDIKNQNKKVAIIQQIINHLYSGIIWSEHDISWFVPSMVQRYEAWKNILSKLRPPERTTNNNSVNALNKF